MVKVIKIGGSSLGSAKQFICAAKRVRAEQFDIVVVSAPGKRKKSERKVTDLLIDYCHSREKRRKALLDAIKRKFFDIARAHPGGVAVARATLSDIERSKDEAFIVSRGEYFSGKMMSLVLCYEFVDAEKVICFSGDALDVEKSLKRAQNTLAGVKTAVLPGFYGKDEKGKVRLMERGGSDVSGAIVARAVNASLYCNSTDVDGVMRCNPNVVKRSGIARRLTYNQLYALSCAGAFVVHPAAAQVLMQSGIPLIVKSTFGKKEGTLVTDDVCLFCEPTLCVAMSGSKGVIALATTPQKRDGLVEQVRRILSRKKIAFRIMPQQSGYSVVVQVQCVEQRDALKSLYIELIKRRKQFPRKHRQKERG